VSQELYILGYFSQVDTAPCNVVKWDGSNVTLLPKAPFGITGVATVHKGTLLVAGSPGLASFNGTTWTRLDSSTGDAVACMEPFGNDLVLAGQFNKLAGYSIGKGAIWDGDSNWSDLYRLDTLLNDKSWAIATLTVYQNQIYVAGNFEVDSRPQFNEIARFDGQHWADVGGGMHGNGLSGVFKLMVWKDELYAAGEFFERDGSPGNCIAKWDGKSWHRLGDGITGYREAAIYDMAVYHGSLYVVGPFTHAGGLPADGIAKWDGEKWCSLGSQFENAILSIENFKGDLYIGGGFKNIDGDTSLCRLVKWIGEDYVEVCDPALKVEPTRLVNGLIYPNPASNSIHFRMTGIKDARIYDMAGRLLKVADRDELNHGLWIGHLANGLYIIQATSEKETVIKKFQKL
jgi:hypothetical protein